MVWGALILLVVDRLVKYFALQSSSFFPGTINSTVIFLIYVQPVGGSLISLGVLASVGIVMWHFWGPLTQFTKKRIMVYLVLIFGGGVSNVFDRFYYGGAIDMFSIPGLILFNLADIALLGGVLCLIVELWHQKYIQERL